MVANIYATFELRKYICFLSAYSDGRVVDYAAEIVLLSREYNQHRSGHHCSVVYRRIALFCKGPPARKDKIRCLYQG
jgi:hypothetical protein